MAGDMDPELRDLVAQTLEAKGVLGKIRAELRASVFLALDEHQSFQSPLANNKLKHFLGTETGRLAASIVREFLEFFSLDYTAAVFDPETGLGEDYEGRESLSKNLHLPQHGEEEQPLIAELVSRTQIVQLTQTSDQFVKRQASPASSLFGNDRAFITTLASPTSSSSIDDTYLNKINTTTAAASTVSTTNGSSNILETKIRTLAVTTSDDANLGRTRLSKPIGGENGLLFDPALQRSSGDEGVARELFPGIGQENGRPLADKANSGDERSERSTSSAQSRSVSQRQAAGLLDLGAGVEKDSALSSLLAGPTESKLLGSRHTVLEPLSGSGSVGGLPSIQNQRLTGSSLVSGLPPVKTSLTAGSGSSLVGSHRQEEAESSSSEAPVANIPGLDLSRSQSSGHTSSHHSRSSSKIPMSVRSASQHSKHSPSHHRQPAAASAGDGGVGYDEDFHSSTLSVESSIVEDLVDTTASDTSWLSGKHDLPSHATTTDHSLSDDNDVMSYFETINTK